MADWQREPEGFSCPLPKSDYQEVVLAHGGGGRLSRQLLEEWILPCLENPVLRQLGDSAVLNLEGLRLAFTTDSYTVAPLFFPGGDIGELAVYGTLNDLAVAGAQPRALSLALILEEGLPLETLHRILESIRRAAARLQVPVVTGDTKVVDRGKGDGVYINTAGIGVVPPGRDPGPHRIRPGDHILINGPIGLHGLAILAARQNLFPEETLKSDTGPVGPLIEALYEAGVEIHAMRDPTRGGVASVLNELAAQAGVGITLLEQELPVPPEVEGAAELLGLDPLYIANEGKVLIFVAEDQADRALEVLRQHPLGREARDIGRVTEEHPGLVVLHTVIGGRRVVDLLSGEQLPRIC